MPTRNDVTGDTLVSRTNSDQYRSNYDRIFGKKKSKESTNSNSQSNTEKKD